jgi:putative FmdB family regulatory protein
MFEYACRGCGRHFEAFVTADRAAACPACQGADLQKLLSSPGMVGTAGRREAEALPVDPRADTAGVRPDPVDLVIG